MWGRRSDRGMPRERVCSYTQLRLTLSSAATSLDGQQLVQIGSGSLMQIATDDGVLVSGMFCAVGND